MPDDDPIAVTDTRKLFERIRSICHAHGFEATHMSLIVGDTDDVLIDIPLTPGDPP